MVVTPFIAFLVGILLALLVMFLCAWYERGR